MKREMKDSGIPWIGQIPQDWEISRIGSMCNLGRGRVISHTEIFDNTGDYPVYSSQTSNNGIMGCINTYDFEGDYVTWTTDGANAGTAFMRRGKFNCTNVCGTMQPRTDNIIYLPFLPYILNISTKFSVRFDINPKLMNGMMAQILICLPQINEQRAIADFLDVKCVEVDELIALQEKMIDELKVYKQSVITEAVTKGLNPDAPLIDSGIEWIGQIPEHWVVTPLKYLCKIRTGNQDTQDNVPEGKFPFYVRSPKVERSNKYTFEGESILMAGDGAGAGKIFHLADGRFGCHQRVYCMQGFNKVYRKILYYLLQSTFYLSIDTANTKSTVDSVRLPMLLEFLAFVYPIEEQQQIANYLDTKCAEIDEMTSIKQQKIEQLKEYKKSIIYEYVTGKKQVNIE